MYFSDASSYVLPLLDLFLAGQTKRKLNAEVETPAPVSVRLKQLKDVTSCCLMFSFFVVLYLC